LISATKSRRDRRVGENRFSATKNRRNRRDKGE
jgi:hypothetical protein